MSLGSDLSKVLFAAEPGLLVNDPEAAGRAAAVVADLLGCVLAQFVLRETANYPDILAMITRRIHDAAIDTARRAAAMTDTPESVQ